MRAFDTHKGRCHKINLVPVQLPHAGELGLVGAGGAAPQLGPEDETDNGDDIVAMDLAVDGEPVVAAPAAALLGSQTDDLIAQMYRKHPGMSMSLIDNILQLTRCAPADCKTAVKFFQRIDSLQG